MTDWEKRYVQASDLMDEEKWNEAETLFLELLKESQTTEDRTEVLYDLCDLYKTTKNYKTALDLLKAKAAEHSEISRMTEQKIVLRCLN
jgi:thioredoxin-like negative regulator of GroEL